MVYGMFHSNFVNCVGYTYHEIYQECHHGQHLALKMQLQRYAPLLKKIETLQLGATTKTLKLIILLL